jgi:hypothetical protein
MRQKMLEIFYATGHVRKDGLAHLSQDEAAVTQENVAAIGRNQSLNSYERVFHDELDREDMKLGKVRYPEHTVEPRRRQELADGGMIREDHNAMANLSPRAISHEYPRLGYYATPYIDSMTRVKAQSSKSRKR